MTSISDKEEARGERKKEKKRKERKQRKKTKERKTGVSEYEEVKSENNFGKE
jgi:hypothetical protein